eukprot:34838-Hanusia_phi.AAC.1
MRPPPPRRSPLSSAAACGTGCRAGMAGQWVGTLTAGARALAGTGRGGRQNNFISKSGAVPLIPGRAAGRRPGSRVRHTDGPINHGPARARPFQGVDSKP